MFGLFATSPWGQSLQWRHNGRLKSPASIWFFNRLFRRRSKKTSKLHVTGRCAGNSPGTGEFPSQRASNAENVSILWRHHVVPYAPTVWPGSSSPVVYNVMPVSVVQAPVVHGVCWLVQCSYIIVNVGAQLRITTPMQVYLDIWGDDWFWVLNDGIFLQHNIEGFLDIGVRSSKGHQGLMLTTRLGMEGDLGVIHGAGNLQAFMLR